MKMKNSKWKGLLGAEISECASAEGQAAEFLALTLQSQTVLHKGTYELFP